MFYLHHRKKKKFMLYIKQKCQHKSLVNFYTIVLKKMIFYVTKTKHLDFFVRLLLGHSKSENEVLLKQSKYDIVTFCRVCLLCFMQTPTYVVQVGKHFPCLQ